jgi:hypothetical protein
MFLLMDAPRLPASWPVCSVACSWLSHRRDSMGQPGRCGFCCLLRRTDADPLAGPGSSAQLKTTRFAPLAACMVGSLHGRAVSVFSPPLSFVVEDCFLAVQLSTRGHAALPCALATPMLAD